MAHDTKDMREAASYLDGVGMPSTAGQLREYADLIDTRAQQPSGAQAGLVDRIYAAVEYEIHSRKGIGWDCCDQETQDDISESVKNAIRIVIDASPPPQAGLVEKVESIANEMHKVAHSLCDPNRKAVDVWAHDLLKAVCDASPLPGDGEAEPPLYKFKTLGATTLCVKPATEPPPQQPEVIRAIDASTPEQTDEARDAAKVGDHCWAISSGQLLIVLKVKDEYYEVCGDWECGMRPSELNILAVIPRPAGHETTRLYYLHDAAMSAEGKG